MTNKIFDAFFKFPDFVYVLVHVLDTFVPIRMPVCFFISNKPNSRKRVYLQFRFFTLHQHDEYS